MKTRIEYDKYNDVAYSSFCDSAPKQLQTREERPEVVVFRDAMTDIIVGFTVLGIKKSEVWKASLSSLGYEKLIPKFESSAEQTL